MSRFIGSPARSWGTVGAEFGAEEEGAEEKEAEEEGAADEGDEEEGAEEEAAKEEVAEGERAEEEGSELARGGAAEAAVTPAEPRPRAAGSGSWKSLPLKIEPRSLKLL